jgi:hypothetical protein
MALLQKWKDTVKQGIEDTKWDEYDYIIKTEVISYKTRFSKISIPIVNWLYLKAMLWTESGHTNIAWKTRPMQIGNPGDPGLRTLRNGAEGSNIIMEKTLYQAIKSARINEPVINIKAGIAYLYTRMAISEIKSVRDTRDKRIYEYTVVSGDTLGKIAKKKGTTVDELKSMNPQAVAMIKPRQKLKYHKAKMDRVIVRWRLFTAQNIAQRYNVGDPSYAEKLEYLIKEVFPKLKRNKKTKK